MDTTQELEVIIADYIKELKNQIPNPEQIQLLHEIIEAYKAFRNI